MKSRIRPCHGQISNERKSEIQNNFNKTMSLPSPQPFIHKMENLYLNLPSSLYTYPDLYASPTPQNKNSKPDKFTLHVTRNQRKEESERKTQFATKWCHGNIYEKTPQTHYCHVYTMCVCVLWFPQCSWVRCVVKCICLRCQCMYKSPKCVAASSDMFQWVFCFCLYHIYRISSQGRVPALN